MNPDQRQILLVNARLTQLIRQGLAGESRIIQDETLSKNFFCEYAETFHAFRELKKRLLTALKEKQFKSVDYYLTGEGIDSLPKLLDGTVNENQEDNEMALPLPGVSAYVILLCIREFCQHPKFSERSNVNMLLKSINKEIKKIKKNGRIQLERDDPMIFFKWFEKQFKREYKKVVL